MEEHRKFQVRKLARSGAEHKKDFNMQSDLFFSNWIVFITEILELKNDLGSIQEILPDFRKHEKAMKICFSV